jgi:membrane protein YdbS with pleckstrin-like domain
MARYADGLLADGERIELRTRQHWFSIFAYIGWFWAFAAGTILFFLLARLTTWQVFDWLTLIGLLLALAWTAWRWLDWSFQDYIVTNRRVIKVDGILNKEAADSSLEKINDAVLRQGLLARMLGYGDLEIMTAAESSVDVFKMLDRPADFKKTMLNAKYSLERDIAAPLPGPPLRAPSASPASTAPATPAAGPAGGSPAAGAAAGAAARPMAPDEVTDTLQRLADLRDRGAISAAEFEAKKAELLGRL